MAYAAAKFAESCLKAIQGQPGVTEYAYVSSHLTELPFFASPLRLGPNGIAVCYSLCSLYMHSRTICVLQCTILASSVLTMCWLVQLAGICQSCIFLVSFQVMLSGLNNLLLLGCIVSKIMVGYRSICQLVA